MQPLSSYNAGPGKRVGVIGIGGLGHLGLQFSKALGAETYAISHSPSKKADALKMGADGFIVTKDVAATVKEYGQFFDILLCTSFQDDMPLDDLYFPLLKPRGNMIIVGLPESKLPAMRPQSLFGKSLTGSLIGSPSDIEEMFRVAVKHNVRPWIETRPMSEVNQAVQDMHEGRARYRYVLLNPGNEASSL
jgi:alcohol dehydrogenase (NADP+)